MISHLPVFIFEGSERSIGGPQSFLRNLQTYFKRKQLILAPSLADARVLFVSVSCPLLLLWQAKLRGIKIVQRLDGLHYRSRNGYWWWWKNKKAWLIYRLFADHIVFQTHYALEQVTLLVGAPVVAFTIIPNATDEETFHADVGDRVPVAPYRFMTSGSFRHLDMVRPLIQALDLFPDTKNFTLDVIGPIASDEIAQALDRPYVRLHGRRTAAEIADQLRGSDLYLFSALNSVCPNVVVEALASGLPVVAFASGGVRELMGRDLSGLVETPEKVLHTEDDFAPAAFYQSLTRVLAELPRLREAARMSAPLHYLNGMGEAYESLLRKLCGEDE